MRRMTGDEELRPYVIVNEIGKGSFATVYKGYHEVGVFYFLHHSPPFITGSHDI